MKRILTWVLCLVVLFGMSGCSSDSKVADKEAVEKTEEKEHTNSKKAIKLKNKAPNPKDYIKDEYISSEEFNGKDAYTFFIDSCTNRTFYDKYSKACKDAGFVVDNIEEIDDGEDHVAFRSCYYKASLDSDVQFGIEIMYFADDQYTRVIVYN